MLAVAVSTAGCTQTAETPPDPSLTGLQILFKLDHRLLGPTYGGERWVSPPTYGPVRASGNSYVVEARAEVLDNNGQPRQANFEWKPEDPEMVAVSPSQGDEVTINIQRAGESRLQVTSQGVSKTLNIRATQQKGVIQVEISQADEPG